MNEEKPKPNIRTREQVVRVAGQLRRLVTFIDEEGRAIKRIVSPLMVEFTLKDMAQVIVGASILAIPVGFTEETWKIGETIPLRNIVIVFLLSVLFISLLIYHTTYRGVEFKKYRGEYFKRVMSTYVLTFLVVATLLTLIEKAPWSTDLAIAVKRTVLVSMPACVSAAIADMIR